MKEKIKDDNHRFVDNYIITILFMFSLAPIFLFFFIDSLFKKPVVGFLNLDIYFDFTSNILPYVVVSSMFLFSLFLSFVRSLDLEGKKIKKCLSMFDGEKIFKSNNDKVFQYSSFVFLFAFSFYNFEYFLGKNNELIDFGLKIDFGLNLLTLEKNSLFNYYYYLSFVVSFALFFSSLLMMISFKKKLDNLYFVIGFFIVPLMFTYFYSLMFTYFYSFVLKIDSSDSFLNFYSDQSIFKGWGPYFKILICFIVFNFYFSKNNKSDNYFGAIFGAFTCSYLCYFLAVQLFLSSPTYEILKNTDGGKVDIDVYGVTYKVGQTFLPLTESPDIEYLVQGYSGLSFHSSSEVINKILKRKNNKSIEKSLKFSADMLLNNFEKHSATHKRNVDFLTSEKLESGLAINLMMPIIIYESSPIEHNRRSLESIVKGNYQDAVDFYIEDALNNEEETTTYFKFKKEEHNIIKGSFGHNNLREMIEYIIYYDLAKIDFNKIIESKRDELKEGIEKFELNDGRIKEERVNQFFDIFKTDRLM